MSHCDSMDRVEREIEHFSKTVRSSGFTWWGDRTKAGQSRLDVKASLLKKYANLEKGTLVLEIGCGTGEMSKRLSSSGASIIATDVAPELIRFAKDTIKHRNLNFQVADATKLPFPDNYFDVVLGRSILHHVNLAQCVTEIKRVLKVSGRFIFSEPNMLNPFLCLGLRSRWCRKKMAFSEDETAFYKWWIKRLFIKAGFRNLDVFSFDFVYPSFSGWLFELAKILSPWMERIPLIKEFGGSLLIRGTK